MTEEILSKQLKNRLDVYIVSFGEHPEEIDSGYDVFSSAKEALNFARRVIAEEDDEYTYCSIIKRTVDDYDHISPHIIEKMSENEKKRIQVSDAIIKAAKLK